MKILVTGGAGYIGSHMVKALLEDGVEVVVVDSLERGHRVSVGQDAKLLVGSLLDKQFVAEVFRPATFDAVLHFAGFISMEESMEKPGMYFENNIVSTLNLLEAMVTSNIKKIIFSSTAGVYGDPKVLPIPEKHEKNPTNPYSESKLTIEKFLYWYGKIYGIQSVALRYFNAGGASLDGSLGEEHNPETHLIPNAIKAALENRAFYLYGGDYQTRDGTAIRDYIHVVDLIDGHLLCLKNLIEGGQQNLFYEYNVGTGRGHTNREVIAMVKELSGRDFPVKVVGRRPGDAQELVADASKMRKDLGFSPKYSDLETIIKTALAFSKKRLYAQE